MQHGAFELFEHTADVGFEVWADAPGPLFVTAVSALFHVMGKPATADGDHLARIELSADVLDELLVDVLNEAIAKLELDELFFTNAVDAEVVERDDQWHANLSYNAHRIDRRRERDLVEVKAATYHLLSAHPVDDGWYARIVLDL